MSPFYSLVSPTKKKNFSFFLRLSFVVLRACTRDARGDVAFRFRFNRTRRARGSRSSKWWTLPNFFFETVLLFRVCIKKIREKLCLTLSSHSHSPARAQRETDRKKERQTDEKQKQRSHTARSSLFALLEGSTHTALVHSQTLVFVLFLLLFFFSCIREGKKKKDFKIKKGGEKK